MYGGPGSHIVTEGFRLDWHVALASEGFIVAVVDGRGAGGYGLDYMQVVYGRLGLLESEDQVDAARYFATLNYVDAARIGIWGWVCLSPVSYSRASGIFSYL